MVRSTFLVLYFVLACSSILRAQSLEKLKGRAGGESYSYHVMNTSRPVKGIVLLMPSRGESPKELFWHTKIPSALATQGFVTIVPVVDYSLILKNKTKQILDHVIARESAKAKIDASNLVIGGFSSGGAIAAHFAEARVNDQGTGSVKGVFLIDPPLDLARFYNAWVGIASTACPKVLIS